MSVLLLLILLHTSIAMARPLTIEDLFTPFEYLNIENIYDRYSALIDLLIFTLVFVGLAQATLGHKYPGPGGRAVAIGVGLSLAISLLIAESTWDFNLKTLGPLAAAIVMLVLGVMIYQFLHQAGLSRAGAAGAAYLMTFFGMTAAAPGVFDWLNTNIPILSAIAVFGILSSLFALLSGLHFHPGRIANLKERWTTAQKNSPRHKERVKRLNQEAEYIKKAAKPAIAKELETQHHMETDLRALRDTITRRGAEPGAHQSIIQDLQRITAEAERIQEDIQRVWELNTRLQEFDRELFHEDYVREVEAMNPQEQTQLKQSIQQQLRKIAAEKRLRDIQTNAAKYLEALREQIRETVQALTEGNVPMAVTAIDRAIRTAQAITRLTRQTEAIEKALLKFTRRQAANSP